MGFLKEFIMEHPFISMIIGVALLNRAEDAVGVYQARKYGYNYKGHTRSWTNTPETKKDGDISHVESDSNT